VNFSQHGTFHFAIQTQIFEDLLAKIGPRRGANNGCPYGNIVPNDKPYRMVYVEDPWHCIRAVYAQLRADLFAGAIVNRADFRGRWWPSARIEQAQFKEKNFDIGGNLLRGKGRFVGIAISRKDFSCLLALFCN